MPAASDARHTLRASTFGLACVILACATCCRRSGSSPIPTEDRKVSVPTVSSDASPPRSLRTPGALAPLEVPGFPPAFISIPQGVTSPRPVLVATHGLWDGPEGLCDNWRWILGDRGWVVCPRGDLQPNDTFRYASGPALAKEIDADLRALVARYPGYVSDGPVVYSGFSLGAILGVWIVSHDPTRYPRAVFIEGGEDRISPESASAFARGGGQRVLFACGLKFRVPAATRASHILEKAGIPSRVVLGKLPDAGEFIHWYNGPVADEIKAQLAWLIEGDARWSAE
jgi:hypothetical protein